MARQFNLRVAIWFVLVLFFVTSIIAVAASNSVPSTRLARRTFAISANALKPVECAALNLTAVIYCPAAGGPCAGTDASELILGGPNADDISAGKGDDCIVGGGGDDFLKGEQGNDVCLGGPGNDSFHPSCETQVQ